MKYATTVLIIILVWSFLYAAGAYVSLETSPSKWNESGRVMHAISMVSSAMFIIGIRHGKNI